MENKIEVLIDKLERLKKHNTLTPEFIEEIDNIILQIKELSSTSTFDKLLDNAKKISDILDIRLLKILYEHFLGP